MTDPDQPQDFAVIQISTYLQQLILHDMLAKTIAAQQEGGDYLPLLKSLSAITQGQGDSTAKEKAEWGLITELCSLVVAAAQQRSGEQ